MPQINLLSASVIVAAVAFGGALLRDTVTDFATAFGTNIRDQLWPASVQKNVAQAQEFYWSSIQPSKDFVFHPCYGRYECARLEVPLDWNNTAPGNYIVALAVLRLPAKVPITDPNYGGMVFASPGGPGYPAIDFFLRFATAIQTIVDAPHNEDRDDGTSIEEGKFFDMLIFDPRGVKYTTPFATCFEDPADLSANGFAEDDVIGTPEASVQWKWARQKAIGEGCMRSNVSKIMNYVSTPYVVRDIVEILERWGKWRQDQSESLTTDQSVRDRLRWRKGEEQLQYWGISYGSLLGNTFAAMQPHRVHRVMLDAIVDPEEYYTDGFGPGNLADTDEMMEQFFEFCFAAGPEKCPLNSNSASAAEIKKSFFALQDRLAQNPLPVPGTNERGPDVITLSDVKNLVFWTSYAPLQRWQYLAKFASELLRGDGAAAADTRRLLRRMFAAAARSGTCGARIDSNNPDCGDKYFQFKSSAQAILCTDTDPQITRGFSLAEFQEYWDRVAQSSKFLGDAWAQFRLSCVGWQSNPKWKFDRPIASNVTAHPIFYVGNTLDNVTPIRNARKVTTRFKGSRVLEIDIEGHGSMVSPSLCAARHIRKYFQTGELPGEGLKCLPQSRPILGNKGPRVEALPKDISKAEMALWKALEEISLSWP